MTELGGVYPVFNTTFLDDESLDLDTLRRELDWIADQGADGLTFGMVSEYLRLAPDERLAIAQVAAEVAHARGIGAVISVGAESSRLAASFARAAEGAGATAVMAIPPVTLDLGEAATADYFEAILDATNLPLVVQDASGYVGRPLPLKLQVALLERHGERVLFKPEATPVGPRLSALRDATGGTARVFEGTGGASLVDSYKRGVVGTMPGAEVCWAIVRLWRLLQAADFVTAERLSAPLVSMIGYQSSLDSFVVAEKHLLFAQGVLRNKVARGPLAAGLDDETARELDRLCGTLRSRCDESVPETSR
jgi:4-hydroxy-tetrahydrodipicolinate synthase